MFNFFKRDKKQSDEALKDTYTLLTTNDEEIINPTWEQVKIAVDHAQPNQSIFASFAYVHSELEIEVIQVISEADVYRLEAIPSKSSKDYKKIFVNDSLSYEEATNLFAGFYKDGIVEGFRDWPSEKNKF